MTPCTSPSTCRWVWADGWEGSRRARGHRGCATPWFTSVTHPPHTAPPTTLHRTPPPPPIRPEQVELHPFLAAPDLKAYCDARGVVLTGYHPLGSPSRPAQYRAEGNPDVLGCETVSAIAAATGKAPGQVVLRWAVQRGTVPLPRSTTPSRIDDNLNGVVGWALSDAHMAALNALDASKGSAGRIMRGDHLVPEGVDWRTVWDEDWDTAAAVAAIKAASAQQ
jgi:hypothetical protein